MFQKTILNSTVLKMTWMSILVCWAMGCLKNEEWRISNDCSWLGQAQEDGAFLVLGVYNMPGRFQRTTWRFSLFSYLFSNIIKWWNHFSARANLYRFHRNLCSNCLEINSLHYCWNNIFTNFHLPNFHNFLSNLHKMLNKITLM